ncbi:MAG TPA: nuclear transport factor 2 family protein [Mycobacterium sp.]|nr:MAG: nuclear transport factor 2 family protein [Mycobacterium sp.]HMZ14077.1 nuclear transport factor 2 family protein [Mycobacterium sp.]
MTVPPVLERWFEIIASGGSGDVEELLADDAVFYSPAVFTPQRGRAQAAAYLRAAEKLFAGANFRYVGKWFDAHSAVLEFAAEIDGLTVEGIDMIHWNADGKIVSVKVMIRPLKALQAIVPKMAALLQG